MSNLIQDHNGRRLKCVAYHAAFPRRSRETSTLLNVHYAPTVRLQRAKDKESSGLYDLEADVDTVRVRCVADANPRAEVVWRKAAAATSFFRCL